MGTCCWLLGIISRLTDNKGNRLRSAQTRILVNANSFPTLYTNIEKSERLSSTSFRPLLSYHKSWHHPFRIFQTKIYFDICKPQDESCRLAVGGVSALTYWISILVALNDNVVVTLMAQVKPETDDKHRCSGQSHVVPFSLVEPGNSTPTLPVALALSQQKKRKRTFAAAQPATAPSGNTHSAGSNGYY